jgi:hypothetical protein
MFRTFVAGVLSNDDNGTRRDFYYQDVADLKEALRVANERNATLEREKAALRKQLLVMPSASSVAGTGDPSAQRDAAAFMAETPPAHTFATSEGVPPELAAAGGGVRFSLTGDPVLPLSAPLPPFATAPVLGQTTGVPPTSRDGSSRRGGAGGFAYEPANNFSGDVVRERGAYARDKDDLREFAAQLSRQLASAKEQEHEQEQNRRRRSTSAMRRSNENSTEQRRVTYNLPIDIPSPTSSLLSPPTPPPATSMKSVGAAAGGATRAGGASSPQGLRFDGGGATARPSDAHTMHPQAVRLAKRGQSIDRPAVTSSAGGEGAADPAAAEAFFL